MEFSIIDLIGSIVGTVIVYLIANLVSTLYGSLKEGLKNPKKAEYCKIISSFKETSIDLLNLGESYVYDTQKMNRLEDQLDFADRLTHNMYSMGIRFNIINQYLVMFKTVSEISGRIMKYAPNPEIDIITYEKVITINDKIHRLVESIIAFESKLSQNMFRILGCIYTGFTIIMCIILLNSSATDIAWMLLSYKLILIIVLINQSYNQIEKFKQKMKKYYNFNEKIGNTDKEKKIDRYLESVKDRI